jgi:hypothetical protein
MVLKRKVSSLLLMTMESLFVAHDGDYMQTVATATVCTWPARANHGQPVPMSGFQAK